MALIIMILFIILALISLVSAVFFAIDYARASNVRFVDTKDTPLPRSIVSSQQAHSDTLAGYSLSSSISISKTRGKEAGFSFSLKPEQLRAGLQAKDALIVRQFAVLSGFVLFTMFTFAAIGCAIVLAGNAVTGMVFCIAALVFILIYFYQLMYGRSPAKQDEEK